MGSKKSRSAATHELVGLGIGLAMRSRCEGLKPVALGLVERGESVVLERLVGATPDQAVAWTSTQQGYERLLLAVEQPQATTSCNEFTLIIEVIEGGEQAGAWRLSRKILIKAGNWSTGQSPSIPCMRMRMRVWVRWLNTLTAI